VVGFKFGNFIAVAGGMFTWFGECKSEESASWVHRPRNTRSMMQGYAGVSLIESQLEIDKGITRI